MSTSSETTQAKCRVVVLISGNGSNLQALINASRHPDTHFQLVAVISNNAEAYGLKRAEQANIPTITLDHRNYSERIQYDRALIHAIDAYTPDLVTLAGFMRILSKGCVHHYQGRLLNIHPSLLPKYRGLNTHQQVLDAGDTVHGVTVHFVTEELDGGPGVIQSIIPVFENDNSATLAQRVHTSEHLIYPLATEWFAQKRLSLHDNTVYFDEKPLEKPLIYETLYDTNQQPME